MPNVSETKSTQGTVLVVDDEPGPRESLRLILAQIYGVATAGDARQALAALRRALPDVLLLDLKMPEMSGLQLFEEVRQLDSEMEVIIVTGYGSYDSAVRALRLGAFDYISKPFDAPTVTDAVRRAMERRRRRRREVPLERLEEPVADLCQQTSRLETDASRILSEADREILQRIGTLARRLQQLTTTDTGEAGKGSE